MCGICGFNSENKNLVKKMSEQLIHRGPDDYGYYIDSNVSLGMRRLSVIDLKTGQQPQHNENEDIWIIFNGEIYNFKDLRSKLDDFGHSFYTDSDTEVIIHAYEQWGEKCVTKLRGQFAFCIYDSKKKRLFLARDHMGLKPLYYYYDGSVFIFGSEIKSILCYNIPCEVDKQAFDLYLSFTYVPSNLTLFRDILKVPPSSYLIFDLVKKKIEIENYWDFNFIINGNKSEHELSRELIRLIEENVKIRLLSDVPLGVFLSGGLDSSTIVAIMSNLMKKPVKTFSIGFEEGAPINETKYAKFVSDHFNTDHTELIVKSSSYEILPKIIWHLDDLIADAGTIPIYLMSKLAREKMTVALTGDGADEVFAGYSIYYRYQKPIRLKFLPNTFLRTSKYFWKYIPLKSLRTDLKNSYESKNLEERYYRRIIRTSDNEKTVMIPFKSSNMKSLVKSTFKNKNLDLVNRFTNWDLKYQLPNQFNMKVDKMTMATSLEARVPFLDPSIIEWAATIPSDLKLNGNTEKYILRLAMKDILPRAILNRRKCGLSAPVNLWFKAGLEEISEDILKRLEKRKQLINSSYIRIVRNNKLKSVTWKLIMFELWYETFIEADGLKPIKF